MKHEKVWFDTRYFRDEVGLSVPEMADRLSVSRTTLYSMERGNPVRKNKAIQILHSMEKDAIFSPHANQIAAEKYNILKVIGTADIKNSDTIKSLIQAFENLAFRVLDLVDYEGESWENPSAAPDSGQIRRMEVLTKEIEQNLRLVSSVSVKIAPGG